jgi:hypothetical protein
VGLLFSIFIQNGEEDEKKGGQANQIHGRLRLVRHEFDTNPFEAQEHEGRGEETEEAVSGALSEPEKEQGDRP